MAENINDFYICSLSCRSVIYKGMFLAEQLTAFYPDLLDDRFVSNFAIYHQRYSTNTFPTWRLAQPFRVIAHNGEINTLLGNINWMKSHETRMDDTVLRGYVDDIKPVIQGGSSDSAALDAVFELLLRGQRGLPETKLLLIPEAWEKVDVLAAGAPGLLCICQLRHGALGRPSRDLRLWWTLGASWHGSQRPAADALRHNRRRPAWSSGLKPEWFASTNARWSKRVAWGRDR